MMGDFGKYGGGHWLEAVIPIGMGLGIFTLFFAAMGAGPWAILFPVLAGAIIWLAWASTD